MTAVSLPPPLALAPYVAAIDWYETDLPAGRELRIPTGAPLLVVNLAEDQTRWYDSTGRAHRRAGAALCPPAPGPVTIDTAQQRAVACVAFRPHGAYPFLPMPADRLDDHRSAGERNHIALAG